MASKYPAEQRAEHRWQREEEDRRQRVMVITEFGAGEPHATLPALANELKYRQALRLLATAMRATGSRLPSWGLSSAYDHGPRGSS